MTSDARVATFTLRSEMSVYGDIDPRDPDIDTNPVRERVYRPARGQDFRQFDDRARRCQLRYVTRLESLTDRPRWLLLVRYSGLLIVPSLPARTSEQSSCSRSAASHRDDPHKAASDITPFDHATHWSLSLCCTFQFVPIRLCSCRSMVQTDVKSLHCRKDAYSRTSCLARAAYFAHQAAYD